MSNKELISFRMKNGVCHKSASSPSDWGQKQQHSISLPFFYFVFSNIIQQQSGMALQYKANIILQRQEHMPAGCCFDLLSSTSRQTQQQPYMRIKARSEPKLNRQKKIDLVTIKRGFSLNKLQYSPATLGKDKQCKNEKAQAKALPDSRNSATQQSKSTTRKSSLKALKAGISHHLKIQRGQVQHKQLIIKITTAQQKVVIPDAMIPISHQDLDNAPYLSEISLVSEEFISRQSVDGNIFTFLSTAEKKSLQTSTMQHQSAGSLASQRMQGRTPLQRILERNRMQKGVQGKKRLVL